MARNKEVVMNAKFNAFAGKGKAMKAKPTKSYMAIGTSIPKVGEHYKCKRLEKDTFNHLCFYTTETSTVQRVKNLARNVFVVETMNSYYITRVLYMPVENVHLAIVNHEPEIGNQLKCSKFEFYGESARVIPWHTTTVQAVNSIQGLYRVKTNNSTYICFPMM